MQVFGPEGWPKFVPLYQKFSKLADERIKKALAASLHDLARILGPTYTERDLLPVMEKSLKERKYEIKGLALRNMHIFLKELPLERRKDFLPHIQ